jgi:hypothetical protein
MDADATVAGGRPAPCAAQCAAQRVVVTAVFARVTRSMNTGAGRGAPRRNPWAWVQPASMSQRCCHQQGGGDDGGGAGVHPDDGDEAPVDLDHVDGQVDEAGQGGVAGAEVVDDQWAAQLVQGVQLFHGADAAHDLALGDLQAEPVGGQGVASQATGQVVDEGAVGQLLRRDVEVHLRDRRPLPVPLGDISGHRVADPVPDAADEAGLLGDVDELRGGEQAPVWVVPAQERLSGGDRPVREVEDRLVVHLELAAVLRTGELPFQGGAGAQVQWVGVLGELDAVAPAGLGPVHGRVRLGQHVRGVGVGARRGDADAGGDADDAPGDRVVRGDQGEAPFGDAQRVPAVAQVLQQDGELVPAEAGDDVLGAYRLAEPVGDAGEQAVPGGVTVGVVDVLEPVQVDEQHRRVRLGGPREPGQRVVQVLQEQAPGGQAGDRVVGGVVAQLLLRLPLVGQVPPGEQHAAVRGVLLGEPGQDEGDRAQLPGGTRQPYLQRRRGSGRAQPGHRLDQHLAVLGRQQGLHRLVEQLLTGAVGQRAEGVVGPPMAPVRQHRHGHHAQLEVAPPARLDRGT